MLASPNLARLVYHGDGSLFGTQGPEASDIIEHVFNQYFESQGLAYEGTPFTGRSDYGPFIAEGIPAGGLFTGAEEPKTGPKSPATAVSRAPGSTRATTRRATR